MPILLLGYRTPSSQEIPEILYNGDDGDVAIAIADASPLPRIARLINPQIQPIRHWTEAGAETFATFLANQAAAEDITLDLQAGFLYDAYCHAVGGKAFNGDPLPSWGVFRDDPLKAKQSLAWLVVAKMANPDLESEEVPTYGQLVQANAEVTRLLSETQAEVARLSKALDEIKTATKPTQNSITTTSTEQPAQPKPAAPPAGSSSTTPAGGSGGVEKTTGDPAQSTGDEGPQLSANPVEESKDAKAAASAAAKPKK